MKSSDYIGLLKKMLCDYHRTGQTDLRPLYTDPRRGIKLLRLLNRALRKKQFAIGRITTNDAAERTTGRDRPVYADTMIGMKRLDNIEFCVRDLIETNIPGDFIECGVWRGGATILMRALIKEMNVSDRTVWVADSFEGLPVPDIQKYPADRGDQHARFGELAVSLETVKMNFEKYGLLDNQVKFLKGWFKDTLPAAPVQQLALLRLDGDMYESTMDGLVYLYPKLSSGGYIIIDDWGAVPACRKAAEDYRKLHGINEVIESIDWTGIYWKKEKDIRT